MVFSILKIRMFSTESYKYELIDMNEWIGMATDIKRFRLYIRLLYLLLIIMALGLMALPGAESIDYFNMIFKKIMSYLTP